MGNETVNLASADRRIQKAMLAFARHATGPDLSPAWGMFFKLTGLHMPRPLPNWTDEGIGLVLLSFLQNCSEAELDAAADVADRDLNRLEGADLHEVS